MAKNYDAIRVYGDLESEVFFAPKGTALPTTIGTDPAAPFWPVGWISEDGVTLQVSTDVQKFKGWQGGTLLRTKVTSTEKTVKIQALEETPGVTALYYGHGDPVVTAGVAKVDLPESVPTIERTAVFKFKDGGVDKWLCCELVQISDRGEVAHQNSSMTMYEFTLDIIGDAYFLTNAPTFVEA